MIVAFQGERGAFSEEAARKLLGASIDVLPCRTFDEAFAAVANGTAACAVLPIENSLAGSVHRNYELLADHGLAIGGEVFLRISHALIGHRGAKLDEIRHVFSHPVALAQCQRFFADHPRLEATAAYDTAGSVKMVMDGDARHEAAIAGAHAAVLYDAEVIVDEIEDHKENYTRFLLLVPHDTPSPVEREGATRKTTVLFRTPNRPGSLFRALAAFALRDINLSKIESRPIEGRPWEYSFYVDLAGDVAEPNLARAVDHLREMCETVRILGSYPAG